MAKFNQTGARPTGVGVITSETTPSGNTYNGAPGYERDDKSALFLLAVSNMVGEPTFYETTNGRDRRFSDLVAKVAVADGDWFVRFIGWLRDGANMRSASLVAAAEGVKARLAAGVAGGNRQIVAGALKRPDEPGEMLAYWTTHYGRAIPKPIKRGINDALGRLYNERALLKYDTASHAYRFADVLALTHPEASALWQSDLFGYAINRRYGRDEVPETLSTIRNNQRLRQSESADLWLDTEVLREAGMTWEDALSAVGSKVDKARLWTSLVPTMGYMALLRNLRNIQEAGVAEEVMEFIGRRIADPAAVAKSRQFPIRFLSAYQATVGSGGSLRFAWALEQAVNQSVLNIPGLPGRTLILVDRSGSMFQRLSGKSQIAMADAAAVFGTALALRAETADLVQFGTSSQPVNFRTGGSILPIVTGMANLGGTDTAAAVQRHYRPGYHDRLVIITDEQATFGIDWFQQAIPVYTWNLSGYRYGHAPSTHLRYTFGGLTDAGFQMIPLLEAGGRQEWPF